jgi:hypothetical protein
MKRTALRRLRAENTSFPPTYSVYVKSLHHLTFIGSKEARIITDRAREDFSFWLLPEEPTTAQAQATAQIISFAYLR